MSGWVVAICAALLAAVAIMALARMISGPNMVDRVVGLDLLITTIIGGIGLEAVYHRNTTTLPVLVVLTLVGFVGSVAIARFSVYEPQGSQAASDESEAGK